MLNKVIKKSTSLDDTARIMDNSIETISMESEDGEEHFERLSLSERLASDLLADLTEKAKGKYTFRRSIGRGGMKLITEVHDKDTSRPVAVAELLDPSKKAQYSRFVREAKITANLEHPNIVPIHDIGVNADGTPYFTMKLLKGETLASIIKKLRDGEPEYVEKWTLARLLMVFRKICNGVGFAHTKDVVHLDLSPENVQVGQFGEVLVLDWGLAKVLGTEQLSDEPASEEVDRENYKDGMPLMTLDGDIKGTPGYMAPEQAAGKNTDRDKRTDIYSLGAILYTILTYDSPVETQHVDKMLSDTIEGRISPIRKNLVNHHIPSALIAVTLKAMRLDADRRYQTVRDMRKEIDAFMSGFSTEAEQASAITESLLFLKRHKASTAMAVIIFTMALFVSSMIIKEKRRQTGDWKRVYNESFLGKKYDLSQVKFTNEDISREVGAWKVDKDGLYAPQRGWMWLENVSVLGDIKVDIKVKTLGSSNLLLLAINSKLLKLSRPWHRPPGYTFQFGGFNSTNNILYKNNVVLKTDMSQKLIGENNNTEKYHTITMIRVGTDISVKVDGETKVNVTDMFPPIGRAFRRVGIKLLSDKIKIASLTVSRLTLPEKASPLIAGDVLVENLHFSEAVDKYLTIAEDFGTTIVAEKALAKAYFTAATKLKRNQAKYLRKIKFQIKLNFPNFRYDEQILEVDALKAWTNKDYKAAFEVIDELFKLNPKTSVIPKILQIGHSPLPENIGQELLKRIVKSANIQQLDISNYGLSDISELKGMKISMLDCSRNNLSELYPLVGMKLKVLDCSYNNIKNLESLKNIDVEELDCSYNSITELYPLSKSKLKSLNLLGNKISDVEVLNTIKTLEKLVVSCKTKNIEVLKKSESLKYISDSKNNLNMKNSKELFWKKCERKVN